MSYQNYENPASSVPVSSSNPVPTDMTGQPDPSTVAYAPPNPANLVVVDPSVAAASQLNPEGKTTLW